MDTEYNKAIGCLKDSPMFNLSLSSKELFHSNFLYWIWKLDSKAFKCLIAKLLNVSNNDLKWGNSKDWEVVREYHSFDLCVKHCDRTEDVDGKTKNVSGDVLLVLENKVKSIPYKGQLNKYVNKVRELYGLLKDGEDIVDRCGKTTYRNNTYDFNVDSCRSEWPKHVQNRYHKYCQYKSVKYILLTLPTHFPEAPEGIDSEDCNWEVENGYKWKVVTYNKYIETIKSLKDAFTEISDSFNLKEEDKCYVTKIIDDYIKFVEHLLVIYNEWTDKCYDKLGFIYYDKLKQQCSEYIGCITDAQNLRIHDLYHKSKYARICADIISTFGDVNIDDYEVGINLTEKEVSDFVENEACTKKGYIVWEYNYTHGEPLVGVKIARKDKEDNLITYIIQVQSGAYEHGVIADHTKLKGGYQGTKDKKIWEYIRNKCNNNIFSVGDHPWLRYEDFTDDATKGFKENVLVSDNIFVKGCLYPETLPYAKYAGNNSNFAMIYQFRKLQRDVTTSDVIDYLVNDVKQLLEQLNKPQ